MQLGVDIDVYCFCIHVMVICHCFSCLSIVLMLFRIVFDYSQTKASECVNDGCDVM